MRIRTVKPEFWTDSTMVSMSRDTRLVFIGLWNAADDHGWLPDDADQLKMLLFPGDHDFDFEAHLELLIASCRVERHFADDSKWVLCIAHWKDHQKVDHPAKSKIVRESSRKLAIPFVTRKLVAEKYGCKPGERVKAKCYFCDEEGEIHWMRLYNRKPSSWVYFKGLELDHFIPESEGGQGVVGNIVLACRHCNRSKSTGGAIEFLSTSRESSRILAPDQGSGNREQGTGKGKDTPTVPTGTNDLKLRIRILDSQAEEIYEAYPRKQAKPAALKAIKRALSRHSFDLLISGTKAYAVARAGQDPNFTPYPATWFNREQFKDEPSTWGKAEKAFTPPAQFNYDEKF